MEFYNIWAKTYEKDSEMLNYSAPQQVTDFIDAHYTGSHEDAQVLDVACGSGLVAKLMSEVGFKNFVGVDGSQGMLDLADETGLYRELKQALLGTQPLPAQNDTFDLVVIIGALRHGFVPVSTIRELCQAAKPGGYVCMSRVEIKLESGDEYKRCMERELQLMVEEGLWTLVATGEINKYIKDVYHENDKQENEKFLDGCIYLYRKACN